MRVVRAICFAMVVCTPVLAHSTGALEPHDLLTAWTFAPGVTIPLILTAILYARGARGLPMGQRLAFWSGWGLLTAALVSPLHALGEVLFWAHMVQHEVLMLAAAPLLALSRPLAPLLRGMPQAWRRPVGRASKLLAIPASAAWWIHGVAIWAWHAPFLFQATLQSEWMHAAQHASFFISALWFWWALSETSYGAGVLYVFTTSVHTSILGALLTFSPHPLYPAYSATAPAWGFTGLEDQQLGGLIMWVPAGVVYLGAGLALFSQWLRKSDAMLARSAILGVLFVPIILLTACGNSKARAAAALTGGDPERGKTAILHYGCGSCHTITGIASAIGLVGPPLAGIGSRMYVAGMLRNTPENLEYWIRQPRKVNPATAMLDTGVTAHDAVDIAAYLYSVK